MGGGTGTPGTYEDMLLFEEKRTEKYANHAGKLLDELAQVGQKRNPFATLVADCINFATSILQLFVRVDDKKDDFSCYAADHCRGCNCGGGHF